MDPPALVNAPFSIYHTGMFSNQRPLSSWEPFKCKLWPSMVPPLIHDRDAPSLPFHRSLFFWSKYPMIDIYIRPPLLILVWSVLHIADRCFLPRFPHGLPSLFCPSFLPPDERAFTFCPVLALSSIFRVTPTKMRPPDLRPAQAAPPASNELGKQSKSFSSGWLTNFSFGLAIKAVSHGA